MKVSVIASLIVGIHVVVIASVAVQGCTTQRRPDQPVAIDAGEPPVPVMPPMVEPVAPPQEAPVVFQPAPVLPPAAPAPLPAASADATEYVVQKGDSLSKIAAKHGCKTAELQELNGIKDPNKIRAGQKLLLPGASTTVSPAPAKEKAAAKAPVAGPGEYIVQKGDALSKIAARNGCKTKELMELNGIKDANKIRAGQKLKLPGAAAAEPAKAAEPKAEEQKADWVAPLPAAEPEAPAPVPEVVPATPADSPAEPAADMEDVLDYTVQSGDTVESIARLFVVSAADIRKLNGLGNDGEVAPGKVIKIPPTSL